MNPTYRQSFSLKPISGLAKNTAALATYKLVHVKIILFLFQGLQAAAAAVLLPLVSCQLTVFVDRIVALVAIVPIEGGIEFPVLFLRENTNRNYQKYILLNFFYLFQYNELLIYILIFIFNHN